MQQSQRLEQQCSNFVKGQKPQQMKDEIKYIEECIKYNCDGGKWLRGKQCTQAGEEQYTKYITNKKVSIKKEIQQDISCSIEVQQAYLLVADDIMDKGELRRGKLCWYRVDNKGTRAINDCQQQESFMSYIIDTCEIDEITRCKLWKLFRQVKLYTELGQMLDLKTNSINISELKKDDLINIYTIEKYERIVLLKTTYYTFFLPLLSASLINDIEYTREYYDIILQQCTKIGLLFQIQDDYLDCYGDTKKMKKIGTDILENKCTWLLTNAIINSSSEQLDRLYTSQRQDDIKKINNIKLIYNELEIPKKYIIIQDILKNSINDIITSCKSNTILPTDTLNELVSNLTNRDI